MWRTNKLKYLLVLKNENYTILHALINELLTFLLSILIFFFASHIFQLRIYTYEKHNVTWYITANTKFMIHDKFNFQGYSIARMPKHDYSSTSFWLVLLASLHRFAQKPCTNRKNITNYRLFYNLKHSN